MNSRIAVLSVSVFVFCMTTFVRANDVKITLVDKSGAPFPGVLVIVKSLDNNSELGRFLSDSRGNIPPINFQTGLFRLIATCPFGICRTRVIEFMGSEAPKDMKLVLDVKGTDENGETIGSTKQRMVFLDQTGSAIAGGQVLVRDVDAKWEKWYTTDAHGKIEVELLTQDVTVVMIWKGNLMAFDLARECDEHHPDLSRECLSYAAKNEIVIKLREPSRRVAH
jgi:hypothetical protein